MLARKGIAYGPAGPGTGQGHLLDLYIPEMTGPGGDGPWPLVIWSQGSGWMADNGRSTAGMFAGHLMPRGFAVAGVSVRSSAQAHFPGQLDDIKAAISHLRAHAEEYRLDPGRLAIAGDSSGGWLASMAALTVDGIRAAVPFYPPTDLLRMDEQMLPGAIEAFTVFPGAPYGHNHPNSPESKLLGGPLQSQAEAAKQASPLTYVDQAAPPFLILHGQADRIVPYAQGESLYRALAEAGADATLISLPYADHGLWNEFLTDPDIQRDAFVVSANAGRVTGPRPVEPTWDTVADFLHQHLGA